MRIEPVVGTVYSYYTVISTDIKISPDKKRMFHVHCECGKEEYKRAGHLDKGYSKSCKSCASKRTAIHSPPPRVFKGSGDLSKTFYSCYKRGAEERNISFNVSLPFLWGLFLKQEKKCALTGLPIKLEKVSKNSSPDYTNITASLDRIDNTRGYEEDNVWWVHKTVNRLKNNYSVDELKYWCRMILNYDNPEPSLVNDIEVTKKVQRLTGEESTDNPDTSAQPLDFKGEDIV